jgi:hypothetical protein
MELPLFETSAIEALFQVTSGLPRKLNLLAHHALTAAVLAKTKVATVTGFTCGVWPARRRGRGLWAVVVDEKGRVHSSFAVGRGAEAAWTLLA